MATTKTKKSSKSAAPVQTHIELEMDLLMPAFVKAAQDLLAVSEPLSETSDWGLSAEQEEILSRWASTDLALKEIELLLSRDKGELLALMLPLFLSNWRNAQQPIPNPRLASLDAACQLVMKRSAGCVKINLQSETTPLKALKKVGVPAKRASAIAKLITQQTTYNLTSSLHSLRNSDDGPTKAAADSLFDAIQENPAWAALLQAKSEYALKDTAAFFDQLHELTADVGEMRAVLRVIQPQVYPSHAKHRAAFTTLQLRYATEAQIKTEWVVPGGKIKIVQLNENLVLYRKNSQSKWAHAGTYGCTTSDAAHEYAETLLSDPSELAVVLAQLSA